MQTLLPVFQSSCGAVLTPVPITMLMALAPAKHAAAENVALDGDNRRTKAAC